MKDRTTVVKDPVGAEELVECFCDVSQPENLVAKVQRPAGGDLDIHVEVEFSDKGRSGAFKGRARSLLAASDCERHRLFPLRSP